MCLKVNVDYLVFWIPYLVISIESVLCEPEDKRGLSNGLIAKEDNLILHVHS